MNHRLNAPAIGILVVFILAALGLFGYTYWQSSKDSETATTTPETTDVASSTAKIVTVKHDYIDGKHIVAGTIDMPTPCEKLTSEPFFVEGDKSNVEIQFATQNLSEGMCTQVVTPARFKVEFEAPQDASISATLNGEGIVLNIVEVPEGQDLDSFDEYSKG